MISTAIKKLSSLTPNALHALCVGLAILIATRLIYIQHGWINDDSVLYFEAARHFSIGEWKQGVALYDWPLYSALIAVTHQITALSFQTSAQFLTIIFFGIAAFSFLSLIRLAGGNKTVMTCGAFILFSSSYIVGDILPMLLRDQGFWAFFMSGLVFFIQFYRSGKFSYAALWQVSIIIATLFRIEAITFLILLPFILFRLGGLSKRQKCMYFLQSYTLIFSAIITLTPILLLSPSITWDDFGRLKDVISLNTYHEIIHGLMQKTEGIEKVLGGFLDEFALQSLILTLLFIVIAKIISATGWITIGLMAINLKIKTHPISRDAQQILFWGAGLATLNILIIIMNVFVLSGRYVIALSLLIMVFAAFGLATLLDSWHGQSKSIKLQKKLLILIIVILSLSLVRNILPKNPGYTYEQDAVAWVKRNTSPEATVLYVSPRARYYANAPYAGRGVDYWENITNAIKDRSIHNYDYLVLNLDNDYSTRKSYLIATLNRHHLVKEFLNARSTKAILIFQKNR